MAGLSIDMREKLQLGCRERYNTVYGGLCHILPLWGSGGEA